MLSKGHKKFQNADGKKRMQQRIEVQKALLGTTDENNKKSETWKIYPKVGFKSDLDPI